MEIQTDNPNEGYPFPCFSYDDNKCVALNTAYIMCSAQHDVRYILAILNSSLGGFLAKLYVTQLQQRQFRMLAQYVNKFPIVQPTPPQEKSLVKLVQCELNNMSPVIEEEIDEIVFDLYNLSEVEKHYIRNRED